MIDKQLPNSSFAPERSLQPKHERLRDELIQQMVTGRLKPGQRIPSEHNLVRTLGIARTTIRQAMASLEKDGLIRRVQGKGTFVETDARRRLHRGQDIFALIVPETLGGFYPSLLSGFEAAAGDVQHQTIICNSDNDLGRQADIVLQLLDKEVGGVAIVPTSQPLTPVHQIRQLQKQGVPVVFCHRRIEDVSAPLLAIPFYEVGRMAGQALAAHGHQHIAFLTTHQSPVTLASVDGLRAGVREYCCDAPTELVCVGDSIVPKEETVLASLRQVFAKDERPTAVFASFDSLAEMVYLILPRLGLRVPEDVSLIGFGAAWREGALARRLTSVVVDEIATGRQAVSLLHEMRFGNRPIDDNEEIVLGLSLSQGETLAEPALKCELETST
jgi:GntR family transcriptional regulator, arabinose operon transcriptional repressor